MAAPMRFLYIINKNFRILSKCNFISQITVLSSRELSDKGTDSFKYCIDSVSISGDTTEEEIGDLPYQCCLDFNGDYLLSCHAISYKERKYDFENYLCTLLLPDDIRSSAFVIRAFNIEIAQVRDLVSTAAIGEMRFRFWQDTLAETFAGNPPEQPVAKELAKVIQKHKLSKSWFQRLISSREFLLNDKPFLTIKELEEYCDNSVVPVYFLILQSLGITNVHCDHAASHIGKAQGICNLIRGIPYNASKRRSFLPLEIMSKYQISHQDLIHGNAKKKLQEAVYDISSVAHQHLVMARKLSKDVIHNVKPVFLPAVAIAAYLDKLQKTEFDVFHPKNQMRNNWLPIQLLWHKFRNKY